MNKHIFALLTVTSLAFGVPLGSQAANGSSSGSSNTSRSESSRGGRLTEFRTLSKRENDETVRHADADSMPSTAPVSRRARALADHHQLQSAQAMLKAAVAKLKADQSAGNLAALEENKLVVAYAQQQFAAQRRAAKAERVAEAKAAPKSAG